MTKITLCKAKTAPTFIGLPGLHIFEEKKLGHNFFLPNCLKTDPKAGQIFFQKSFIFFQFLKIFIFFTIFIGQWVTNVLTKISPQKEVKLSQISLLRPFRTAFQFHQTIDLKKLTNPYFNQDLNKITHSPCLYTIFFYKQVAFFY